MQLLNVVTLCSGKLLCFSILTAIDCGSPQFCASGVIIDPFNNTKFGALITFHCEVGEILISSLCSSNGEWIPYPNSFECGAPYSTSGK